MRIVNKTLVVLVCAMLTACVNVLPAGSPPAARYGLSPVDSFPSTNAAPVDWSLAIEDPTATRAYDTAKIALTRAPGQIEYFAEGEWVDRAPRLIRIALVRSFENSGRILGVGDAVALPGAKYMLKTDIRAFHVRYENGARRVEVGVFARITDHRGNVLAARLFSEDAVISRDAIPDVGRAFNAAANAAFVQIVDWSFEAVDAVDQAK